MRKNIVYRHNSFFEREFEFLKREGVKFEKHSTAYTDKLVIKDDITVIYNDTGKEDKRLLYLINQVRRDAKEFKQYYRNTEEKNVKFFDMFRPPNDEVLVKVDITGAYWNFSKQRGVITNKTDQLFKKLYRGEDYDVSKGARLKALGSLATCKKIDFYDKGERVEGQAVIDGKLVTGETIIDKQKTSDVYDEICSGIDDVMQECNEVLDGGCVYQYWDCMFVFKEYEKAAIDFFRSKNFKVKTGKSKLTYYRTGKSGYLLCELDDKQYLTRPEHRAILEGIISDYEIETKNDLAINPYYNKATNIVNPDSYRGEDYFKSLLDYRDY